MTEEMVKSGDTLTQATELLTKPSKNTKRKILVAINFSFIFVLVLHIITQLARFGYLPNPARDLVLYPIVLAVMVFSVIYNLYVFISKKEGSKALDTVTAYASIIVSWMVALTIVHVSDNTAISILFDFSLTPIFLFATGTVLGRKWTIIWVIIAIASLFIAYNNRGTNFEYVMMTKAEMQEFKELKKAKDPSITNQIRLMEDERLVPKQLTSLVLISLIFIIISFLPAFFESGMIGNVLGAIPKAINMINIAAEQKHKLEKENLRMSAELGVAQRIQKMVLPHPDELKLCRGLEVGAWMDPAAEVGGDYYDVLPQEDGSVYLGIGDVTDHGLQSGVVMLMTQSAFRATLSQKPDLKDALHRINSVLYENIHTRLIDDRNMTLSLLHYQEGKVKITGQHETVILLRKDKEKPEYINTLDFGIYIGLTNDIDEHIREYNFELNVGDLMLLYTDGATEAENQQKEMFGQIRLMASLEKHRKAASQEIVTGINADIRSWMGSGELLDDITLVAIRRTS